MASLSGSAISSSSVQPLSEAERRRKRSGCTYSCRTPWRCRARRRRPAPGRAAARPPPRSRPSPPGRRSPGSCAARRLVFSGLRKTKTEHQVPAGRKHRGLFSEEEEMGSCTHGRITAFGAMRAAPRMPTRSFAIWIVVKDGRAGDALCLLRRRGSRSRSRSAPLPRSRASSSSLRPSPHRLLEGLLDLPS